MLDFIKNKRWFFLGSTLVIILGFVFLVLLGPPLGIDFTGGTIMEVKFDQPVSLEQLQAKLTDLGHPEAVIQEHLGENSFTIRLKTLAEGEQAKATKALEDLGLSGTPSFDFVSNPVAKEKAQGAAIAVVIASIGILLYISFAFRKLPSPFRYGVCAVIALVHDALVVIALFALLGRYLNLEINLMFITGLLTVIGYSVNDTVVVFDRIRENLGKYSGQKFEAIVNQSLIETLGRSLNTSLTTLIVLVAIFLFVGPAIRSFILALLIGIVSGTYSSIFIAAPLLVVWERGELGQFFRRLRPAASH